MQVKIKKLADNAVVPRYAYSGDAGVDLVSVVDAVIQPNATALIKTGIAIELPDGYEMQIRPRSGLALNNSVTVLNTPGTIDANYRGEICVIIINHGKMPFTVNAGMRIAQMVLNKVERAEFCVVDELSASVRDSKGFGSSGKNT